MESEWHEASNKLMAKRACLRATMLIIFALTVATFFDKAYYTIYSTNELYTTMGGIFSLFLRLSLYVLAIFSIFRVH